MAVCNDIIVNKIDVWYLCDFSIGNLKIELQLASFAF